MFTEPRPCDNCDTSYEECSKRIIGLRGACCSTCEEADSHIEKSNNHTCDHRKYVPVKKMYRVLCGNCYTVLPTPESDTTTYTVQYFRKGKAVQTVIRHIGTLEEATAAANMARGEGASQIKVLRIVASEVVL